MLLPADGSIDLFVRAKLALSESSDVPETLLHESLQPFKEEVVTGHLAGARIIFGHDRWGCIHIREDKLSRSRCLQGHLSQLRQCGVQASMNVESRYRQRRRHIGGSRI